MFPSISKATPQTVRTTSFLANRTMTIVPVTPFAITVNGVSPANPNSVTVVAGDSVTASITTPDDWLWHAFYQYEIDGVPSSFAVVNKSNYTISVKPDDAIKRWYMYTPPVHTATYKATTGSNYSINFSNNYGLIPNDYHVLLNPLDSGVYFFNTDGVQVSKVILPAEPIDYVKIPDKQSVVVLVRGGEAYEIFLNNVTVGIPPFYARRNYSEFTDNNFVFQLPGEDLITYLRRARSREAIPPATCITYDGLFVFAGGNGTVWMVDPLADFTLVHSYDIDEFVMNIAPLPDNAGVILVTQSQKVFKMDYDGNFTELYQGTAVWQPALFNGKVYIPEGNIGFLKVYNPATDSFDTDIALDDFSPSYTTVNAGKLYVAGHDSERVLVFDSLMNVTEKTFPDKVTLVSAVNDTLVASHWMQSFKVLSLTDLRRIVNVQFDSRRGPVSHIGTSAVTVKTLGNDEVFARTPEGTWLWVNGQRAYTEDVRGSLLVDGDIISINRACRVAGLQRTNCIIGDVAYDYDVEAVNQTYFPRNIEFNIEPPGALGVYTKVITLPNYFTPCLMSIEYGVVKVNGAYYFGDFLITAGDIVSIEIETKNNSILPVFTMGARQFVIPVSTNPSYTPIVYEHTNSAPNTTFTDEILFIEFPSLFDYIIPGYYNVTVKKNAVDITGNYFQQFGVGDKMVVTFTSSPKLYDSTDVYILGPTNYKFTARNTLGFPIDYLDYGNVVYPYTRRLDLYDIGTSPYFLSSWYYNVSEYATPEIQYTTANIVISGLVDNSTSASITIEGGDSYFVLDGNIQTNTTITVWNGNNLALARNVVSYFDVPVKVIQHLPTGDDDGFADIQVGIWNIVNREIVEIETISPRGTAAIQQGSIVTHSIGRDLYQSDLETEFYRSNQRNVNSGKEYLDVATLQSTTALSIVADENHIIVDQAGKEELDAAEPLQAEQYYIETFAPTTLRDNANRLSFDRGRLILPFSSKNQREVRTQRTINAPTSKFDKWITRSDISYNAEMDTAIQLSENAYRIIFDDKEPSTAPASVGAIKTQVTNVFGSNKVERLRQNLRLALSYINERDLPGIMVVYDTFIRYYDPDLIRLAEPYRINNLESSETIHPASTVTFDQMEFLSSEDNRVSRVDTNALQESAGKLVVNINTEVVDTMSPIEVFELASTIKHYLPVSKTEINEWIDNDITWQAENFLYTPIEQCQVDSSPASYLFNFGVLPSRPQETYSNGAYSQANREGIQYTNADVAKADVEELSDTRNQTTPAVDESLIPRFQKLLVGDQELENQYFLDTRFKLEQDFAYTLSISKLYRKFELGDTSNQTPGQHYDTGFVTVGVKYSGTNNINFITSESPPDVAVKGDQIFIKMVPNPITLDREIFTGMDFIKFSLAEREYQHYQYAPELPGNASFDKQLMVPYVLSNWFNRPIYVQEDNKRGTTVRPEFGMESVSYNFRKILYTREVFYNGTIRKITYTRDPLIGETFVKPVFNKYLYGIDPIVVYRLSHERQNIEALAPMVLERDRPQLYFTAITLPEIDRGIVWDQDIAVEYGAFATEQDAIAAASGYTDFRPQLIMDTNLWTYRVIFETGLVCPLPSGRYPIAWLIRGG